MSDEEAEKVKVRKSGSVWGWACPCCLNYPGWVGFMFMETAFDAALGHIAEAHPRLDWDELEMMLNA